MSNVKKQCTKNDAVYELLTYMKSNVRRSKNKLIFKDDIFTDESSEKLAVRVLYAFSKILSKKDDIVKSDEE